MDTLFEEYGGLLVSLLGAGIALFLFVGAFISKDFEHLSPVGNIMDAVIGGMM